MRRTEGWKKEGDVNTRKVGQPTSEIVSPVIPCIFHRNSHEFFFSPPRVYSLFVPRPCIGERAIIRALVSWHRKWACGFAVRSRLIIIIVIPSRGINHMDFVTQPPRITETSRSTKPCRGIVLKHHRRHFLTDINEHRPVNDTRGNYTSWNLSSPVIEKNRC